MFRKSVVLSTMILGTIYIVINSAINLLLVPFITSRLGVDAYGFVTLGRNIADYAGIAMLALNSFSARFMSVSYMKGEKKEFSQYYSTVFISDTVIGAILFAIGVAVSLFANDVLNIPVGLEVDVPVLFFFIFLSSYLMFAATAFQSVTYAIKRLDLYNLIRIAGLITQALILIVLFQVNKGKVWYVGLAYLGQYLINFVCCYIVKRRYVRDTCVKRQNFSLAKLKDLLANGIWNSINQVGNVLNSGLDLIITNLYLSTETMGVISITKTISGLFSTLNMTVSQAFQPNFLQLYSEDKQNELLEEFKRATKICGLIANTIFIAFIAFGEDFYRLWVPAVDSSKIYSLTILAIIPVLFEGYVSPLGYIYTLKMKNKVPCYVTIIGGIFNVIGMIVLLNATELREFAVLGTTTVIMTIIYLVFSPIYMAMCLNIKKLYFYPAIIQNVFAALLSGVLMLMCKRKIPTISGWGGLLLYGAIYTSFLLILQMIILLGKKDTILMFRKLFGRRQ